MARGGFRPSAPQNNPANVSATGGNGQSGTQAMRYYSGGAYGEGKQMMEQQAGASMYAAPTPSASTGRAPMPVQMPEAVPLTAPTMRPDEPVTTGIAAGPGAGPEALTLPSTQDTNEDRQRLLSYLPAFEAAAASPNSSQAFRNYVRLLKANLL